MSLKVGVILASITFICLLSPIATSQQPDPPGWDLGIEYPQEDQENPFELSSSGTATVTFYVSNNELLPITIDFEYDIPFEGAHDGPESETIGAGNNKTFTLAISSIDVRNNPAEPPRNSASPDFWSREALSHSQFRTPGAVQESC